MEAISVKMCSMPRIIYYAELLDVRMETQFIQKSIQTNQ